MDEQRRIRAGGLQLKIFIGYTLLACVLLFLLNTYPLSQTRSQLILAREVQMRSDFGAYAAALESAPALDYETAANALSILDIGRDHRVLVTDEGGRVVYDNLKTSDIIGKTVLFPEVIEALCGKDVFRCVYTNEAFTYRAACAVIKNGAVSGSVYAHQYDSESALLLADTRAEIARISIAVFIMMALFIFVFTTSLRRRFDRVLQGVYQVGAGNYDYRIDLHGSDELGVIAAEFDKMSGQLAKNESIRRQFVSDASHELKTPLASIKLLCDSILMAGEMKAADLREFLTDIREEIDRLTRITEGLLYISRMENGGNMGGICDLSHTLARAGELLRGSAGAKGVEIVYQGLPESAWVSGNPDMIYQVVFNLMENAIKYNKSGGRVQLALEIREDQTLLYVADTGIGIREEELERIFDRFYRVDKMRASETRGTGLGLSIVGQCMEAIGGHIEVSSTYGDGTCFTAYFKNAPELEEEMGDWEGGEAV